MAITATYINSTTFSVEGNQTDHFTAGRRVKANLGNDGTVYLTIVSSSVNGDGDTEVVVVESDLTANLTMVLYGVIGVGVSGGLPIHDHSDDDHGGDVGYAEHASSHTDGTDDIQSATAAQKGLATAAQITKLDAIDENCTLAGFRRYAIMYG